MILSAADLGARLNNPRNSERGKRRLRSPIPTGSRTVEDLDRNDIPAGPNLYIRNSTPGSRPGDSKLPDEVKIPAAVLANLGLSSDEMQESFGISKTTANNLKHGRNLDPDAKEKVDGILAGIREKVVEKLEVSADYLTEDKFKNANGKDLVGMMKGLASTIKDITPADKSAGASRVQVVIHSINQKSDEHYEVIEVNS